MCGKHTIYSLCAFRKGEETIGAPQEALPCQFQDPSRPLRTHACQVPTFKCLLHAYHPVSYSLSMWPNLKQWMQLKPFP